jgi:catechol 2,3-dioxygenase-like lactoylglutathione lyase family enzyme
MTAGGRPRVTCATLRRRRHHGRGSRPCDRLSSWRWAWTSRQDVRRGRVPQHGLRPFRLPDRDRHVNPPGDGARLEFSSFVRPDSVPGSPAAMANELGVRNVAFEVNDLQAAVDWATTEGYGLVGGIGEYEGVWRMAYVRGPEGIIVASRAHWLSLATPSSAAARLGAGASRVRSGTTANTNPAGAQVAEVRRDSAAGSAQARSADGPRRRCWPPRSSRRRRPAGPRSSPGGPRTGAGRSGPVRCS